MLLVLFLKLAEASTPKPEIKLLCLQPITGPIPDFGVVGAWADQAIVDRINANPALLPDYTLKCEYVDSGCNPAVAEQEVLGLFFTGSIQTTTWQTSPFEKEKCSAAAEQLGNIGSATYVGVIGPACSGGMRAVANFASKALKPLIAHASTAPDLSDRTAYPYFWRSVQPDTAGLRAIGPTLAALGVKEVMVVSGPTTDSFTSVAIEGILASGLELVGGLPFPPEAGLSGRGLYFGNAAAVGEAVTREEAELLAKSFKQSPSRFVMMSLYDDAINALLCEMSKVGVSGVVPVSVTFMLKLSPEESPAWAHGCTQEDVKPLLYGSLSFGPVFPRSDRGKEHGCIGGGVDPVDLLADLQAQLPGLAFFDYAAPTVDSVCVFAKAIHEMIYTEGYTLEQLNNMDKPTFETMQKQIGSVDFEGTTGRVRYKDQGDPMGLPGPDPDLFLQEIVQFYEDGNERVGLADTVGTTWSVTELKFSGFGAVDTYSFAAPAPLAQFQTCLGQELDFTQNMCVACPPGSESTAQGCAVCRPGFFSGGTAGADGTTTCSPCAPGSFTNADGSASCDSCAPGFIANGPGMTACAACEPGTYGNEERTECVRCSVGTFQENTGATSCQKCDESFITAGVGTASETDCTCAPGTYWSRAENECLSCPAEAFCAGGLSLPLVYDGFYGEHVGDVSAATLLAQNEAKAAGSFVKDPAAFSHTLVYKCKSAKVCPGETMEVSSYGFAAEAVLTKENMRVGFPLEGSCLPNREGIACGRCASEMYGADECKACGSAPVNFVILILGPLFMLFGYHCAKPTQGRARLLNAFILVSLCGMIVFFIQSLAVLGSINVGWPAEMNWLFGLARLFLFDFTGMTFSCWSGNSFIARYVSALLVPLFMVLFMLVAFGVSKVSESLKMEVLTTVSFFGMLMTAFYVTLVKHVVTYFECAPNPGSTTPETLANYRDVTCDSSEREEATGAMVLGLLVYCFGFYLINVYLAYVAPVQWNNARFRQYARFLVNRWRPDFWWWGVALLTRNVLVASSSLFGTDVSVQLLVLTTLVTLYAVLVGVFQPWVVPGLNTFEIAATLLLALLGTVGLIFNAFQRERGILLQLEDAWAKDSVDGLDSQLSKFGTVILVIIALFMVMFFGLLIWCLSSLPYSRVAENVRKLGERQASLLGELKQVIESKDFTLLLEAVVVHGTEYDRQRFDELLKKFACVAFTEPGKLESAFVRPPSDRHVQELKESMTPKAAAVVSA